MKSTKLFDFGYVKFLDNTPYRYLIINDILCFKLAYKKYFDKDIDRIDIETFCFNNGIKYYINRNLSIFDNNRYRMTINSNRFTKIELQEIRHKDKFQDKLNRLINEI